MWCVVWSKQRFETKAIVSFSVAAVALAFEAQLVDSVPIAPHDIDVDILATAKGFLACSTSGEEALSVAAPL